MYIIPKTVFHESFDDGSGGGHGRGGGGGSSINSSRTRQNTKIYGVKDGPRWNHRNGPYRVLNGT